MFRRLAQHPGHARSRSSIRFAFPALLVSGLAALSVLGACTGERPGPDRVPAEVSNLAAEGAAFTELADGPRGTASSDFWEHWGDGRAELASYAVTLSRYGEPREGELVLIYVTEPHDRRTWIKDDGVEGRNRVEVLKLNASLKFLTGVYPYSVMTSVFAPVDDWGRPRFQPVKLGLTAQEWCGHYLHEVWAGREAMRSLRISYFASDGETLSRSETPEGTLFEDALLIQLRELDGPFAEGGSWEGWIVPSLWNVRRGHGSLEPVRATITRERVATPEDGGLTRFTLEYGDYRREYDVETSYPHRVAAWRTSVGDSARLVRATRLPYWNENDPDGRRHRLDLGLSPSSSGVPPAWNGDAMRSGAPGP